jgi:hypothetical protein
MRKRLIIILIFIPIMSFSQNGITFKIEDLTKPDRLLFLDNYDDILKQLMLSDVNLTKLDYLSDRIDFPFNIIAKSKAPDSLVSFGYHPFFNGMYQAYADHRPFVLSPDMIWLLISQGFANHVNANSEKLRSYFVDFSGKLSLVVKNDEITLDNPNSPWEKVFPEFKDQISKYTGSELTNILTCDFSTTTTTEKVASEITIMNALKSYFEFVVISVICGIPEVTLKGTTEDWQKVLDKTRSLKKYDLKWWIDDLEPILKEFIKASKGDVNEKFWRNMFKYHTKKAYGSPRVIDGWIIKFFPYDKDGKRNNLKELSSGDNLPEEIVKVDLEFIGIDNGTSVTTTLELWAGFVGLEQNTENFALTPKIGWMIRKKAESKSNFKKQLQKENDPELGQIRIRVKEIPDEILQLKEIHVLNVVFIDKIIIPDRISNMKIGYLRLYGKIEKDEIERICKLLPNTHLSINGKRIDPKKR